MRSRWARESRPSDRHQLAACILAVHLSIDQNLQMAQHLTFVTCRGLLAVGIDSRLTYLLHIIICVSQELDH